jgi:signal transduction histidine kinase
MGDTNPTDEDDVFPIDRYPDPVMKYTVEDGEPEIKAVNDAFESMFGPLSSRVPVRTVIERVGISVSDTSREFLDDLDGDDLFLANVETVAANYCARVLPPTGDTDGFVFLIDDAVIDRDASAMYSGSDQGGIEGGTDRSRQNGDRQTRDTEFDVDRVASVLSHDLRNPLDVAKARLRAARETGADEHFDHVEKAHERMERIIEDVLTLSRETRCIDPDETVDLRAVVEEAWETVETGGATLTIADELAKTVADGDRIERLFENLFRNAVEHGEHPAVTVGSLEEAATGLYVADDGPGIPREDRSVIFEPGYSSRDHGTGLGLSIVKRIVESHGWTIELKNQDSGARFEIREMGFRS